MEPKIIVDVHFQGVFSRYPITYTGGMHQMLENIDFAGMDKDECYKFMERFTQKECKKLYYCYPDVEFPEGLRLIDNEYDYADFVSTGYECGVVLPMYVDHVGEGNVQEWYEEDCHMDNCCTPEEKTIPASLPEEDDAEYSTFDDEVLGPDNEMHEIIEPEDDVYEDDAVENLAHVEQHIFNEDVHWKNQQLVLGMRFESPKQLKHMLCNYAVAHGYQLCFKKNDSRRLLVKCCSGQCTFRLWGSRMSDEQSFQIKSLIHEHNCARNFRLGSIVTYRWIANHFTSEFVNNQKLSVRLLREEVKKKFGIEVSMSQCRRAKKHALFLVEGTIVEHYAKLWSYGEEIRRSNPGSTFKLDVNSMADGKNYFSKLYICFDGVKQGWRTGCRRIIGLDGCFLKSSCQGELLCVVGRDANEQIFPIAWAVVCVENKENWKWFLEYLAEDLGLNSRFHLQPGTGVVLMSDQHKGLIEAVKEVLPGAEHRQCARHIFANFRKRFSGAQFQNLFWKASKSSTVQKFNATMKEVQLINPAAYAYQMERDPSTWSRAFFKVDSACESVENGMSESFNSVLVDARKKPIISMLEDICFYVMERMFNMRAKGEGWSMFSVCPAIRAKLNELRIHQRYWQVVPSGLNLFETRNMNQSYTVDLGKKTCACRMWQLNRYGCVHSVATLAFLNRALDTPYVDPLYTATFYMNSYNHPINGLNGSNMWPTTDFIPPLPPLKRRMPGRPKQKRRRDASEMSGTHRVSKAGKKVKCGICKQDGHNRSTCPKVGRTCKLNIRKRKKMQQTQESVNMEGGVHASGVEDSRVQSNVSKMKRLKISQETINQAGVSEQVGVQEEGVKKKVVKEGGVKVGHLKRRKKSERILKLKLAKRIEGEGSSAGMPMDLE